MATLDDVRAISLDLPGVIEKVEGHRGGRSWRVSSGMLVWERPPSKTDLVALAELGRQWPEGVVVGVHTDGIATKEALVESFPSAFFTIPHFDGYPAVLVMLAGIGLDQLGEVITDAWLDRAPKKIVRQWMTDHGGGGIR